MGGHVVRHHMSADNECTMQYIATLVIFRLVSKAQHDLINKRDVHQQYHYWCQVTKHCRDIPHLTNGFFKSE